MRVPRRATRLAAALAIAGLALTPLLGAQAAFADDGPSFSGTAKATGVDLVITNSSLPLGLSPEGSGPLAQASLDSLGTSEALSAFPDLGSTVDGIPGLAGALFGNLPLPAYPLVVASNISRPHIDQGVPGIELHAASSSGLAEARTTVGAMSTGFTSTASVEQLSDKSVQATGQTTFGVNLLNLVSLSGVSSTAQVTADALSGALTRKASMSIGQISVAGLSLAIPPSTPGNIPIPIPVPGVPQLPPINLPTLPLPLGGTTLPIPDLGFENGTFTVTLPVLGNALKFAVPASLVLNAFKALGITVSYQTAVNTTTGITAPALTFAFTVPSPPQNNYFNGPTGVSFTLGGSSASVTLHPAFPTGGSPGGGVVSGSGNTGGSLTTGTGGGDLGGGVLPGGGASTPVISDPGTSTGNGAGTTNPIASGPTTPTLTPTAFEDLNQTDLSGVYLAAVAVAAVALAAASILRLLGVRLLWGS